MGDRGPRDAFEIAVVDVEVEPALLGGLSCFLREVYLATHTIVIDPDRYGRAAGLPRASR